MKSKKIRAPVLQQLVKVKEKYAKALLSIPNVSGVGIGCKITQGIQTDTPCIKVYVNKKASSKTFSKNQTIPAQLSGIPTDVEEIGSIKANA